MKLSGAALLACGFLVSGRPLSTQPEIGDLNQNAPSLFSDWTSSVPGKPVTLPHLRDTSPSVFSPDLGVSVVKPEVPVTFDDDTYAGIDSVNPSNPIAPDTSPVYPEEKHDVSTTQVGLGSTQPSQPGFRDTTANPFGSSFKIASSVASDFTPYFESIENNWSKWCYFEYSRENDRLLYKTSGSSGWRQFMDIVAIAEPGYAIFRTDGNTIISMKNLLKGCNSESSDSSCNQPENALQQFQPQWDALVNRVFSDMRTVDQVVSPDSDFAEIEQELQDKAI